MKIIKEPFINHCYIIGEKTISETQELLDWLNTYAPGKWRPEGYNIIRILDESIETMFILKWVK